MMEQSIDKMVYICYEYGNDYENADRVADLVREKEYCKRYDIPVREREGDI